MAEEIKELEVKDKELIEKTKESKESTVRELRMIQNFLYKLLEENQKLNKTMEEIKHDISTYGNVFVRKCNK